MIFNEDSRVKIPSILHLMKLGYTYLSLKDHDWDIGTNIFTDIFNKQNWLAEKLGKSYNIVNDYVQ